jgi:hypothetical protein
MRELLVLAAVGCNGCYLPPVTPATVESGTYQLLVSNGVGLFAGTAWTIDEHHVVTAGHMCQGMEPDVVLSSGSRDIRGRIVEWEESDDGQRDLCLISTAATLPHPLTVADRMPAMGDRVDYVGYPNGVESRSEGKFLGDLDGTGHLNDATFSAQCDHGASGSAVFTDRGVWGVLVRLRTDGNHLHDGSDGCAAIPLDVLDAFLTDALPGWV